MASKIASSRGLLLAALAESIIASLLFPQQLPKYTLPYLFLQLYSLQLAILAIYNVLIYPFFLSPLRHLPKPKVPSTSPTTLKPH